MATDALVPFREAPESSALIFDVDGTLAPIVPRPELAAVPPEVRAELASLASRYLLVGFVSGRPGAEAERIVGVPGARYVGNHGLELDARARALAPAIEAFRDSVDLEVEDKGLTLTYHFRTAENELAARAELEEIAGRARAEGLIPRWGRKVLEIRPDVEADKGTAVLALIRESGARRALYAGDDTTDLDAFTALSEAGLDHVLRIAVHSTEAPEALADAADLVVTGPDALAVLLTHL
jgi:trehalose 6-phosphate phosphatase